MIPSTHITLQYVQPSKLINFFISSQININSKFKYNAQNFNMTIDQINKSFQFFPSIMLTGLKIIDSINLNKLNIINTHHLTHIHLSNEKNPYATHENISLNILKSCINLTSLFITNISIQSNHFFDPLKHCHLLHTLYISNCHNEIETNTFPTLLSLKRLILRNTQLNFPLNNLQNSPIITFMIFNSTFTSHADIPCNKLKKLFIGISNITTTPNFICPNLTHLTLFGNLSQHINIIHNQKNLISIDISWSKNLNINPLKFCSKLKYLKIRGCHITDITPLTKCQQLKYLDMSKTPYLQNIDALKECKKLKIIRTNDHNIYTSLHPSIIKYNHDALPPYNKKFIFPPIFS